jgi:hypothetical protein
MHLLLRWTANKCGSFPTLGGRAVTRYCTLRRAVKSKQFGQSQFECFVEFVSLSWLVMLILYFNIDLTH